MTTYLETLDFINGYDEDFLRNIIGAYHESTVPINGKLIGIILFDLIGEGEAMETLFKEKQYNRSFRNAARGYLRLAKLTFGMYQLVPEFAISKTDEAKDLRERVSDEIKNKINELLVQDPNGFSLVDFAHIKNIELAYDLSLDSVPYADGSRKATERYKTLYNVVKARLDS